jgi:hypothetical protein
LLDRLLNIHGVPVPVDLMEPSESLSQLVYEVAQCSVNEQIPWGKRISALDFFCLCFQSLEIDNLRREILRYNDSSPYMVIILKTKIAQAKCIVGADK